MSVKEGRLPETSPLPQPRDTSREITRHLLLKEGKPEESSLAALAGNAGVITYEEDEEPLTDEEELDDA